METWTDPIVTTARSAFGLDYLYPYQRLVIANTVEANPERRHQVVVLPTGSGKSLCFTLPALLVKGLTVVVYPLLALIDDQRRRMSEAGIETRVLRGGQTRAERAEIFVAVRSGAVRCLLTNPEMLATAATRRHLSEVTIAHLVIDEAHCVTEWGETFRPAYLTLGETIDALNPAVTTAFTATASPIVLESVTRILFGSRQPQLVQGDPDRPNIAYNVVEVDSRENAIETLLRSGIERPAIIFCRSRKRTEAVARDIARTTGFDRCAAYHAGLTSDERAAIEAWFFASRDGVLAATCAYGMGVDKSNIRTVIHYDSPASVEAFLQESGRAGRDHHPARSIVLAHRATSPRESDPLRLARERIMADYLTCGQCRRSYLMAALGAEAAVCFGCDHCTPDDVPTAIARTRAAVGAARLDAVRRVRHNRRAYTPHGLVAALDPAWPESARRELVGSLLHDRSIRMIRRGPWRGRVTTAGTIEHGGRRV